MEDKPEVEAASRRFSENEPAGVAQTAKSADATQSRPETQTGAPAAIITPCEQRSEEAFFGVRRQSEAATPLSGAVSICESLKAVSPVASLPLPPHSKDGDPESLATSPEPPPPLPHAPPPPAPAPPATPPAASSRRRATAPRWLLLATATAGALLALAAAGYLAYAAYLGHANTVTLVNGTGRPYTVHIDDKPHAFAKNDGTLQDVLHLKLPSGAHTVRASIDAPGGAIVYKGEFDIDAGPLLTRPFRGRNATIINPDRLAAVFHVKMGISKAGTPDAQYVHDGQPALHVGEDIIQLPLADYYFADAPGTKGAWKGWRSHTNMIRMPPANMIAYIENAKNRATAVAYLNRLGRMNPSDRRVSVCAAHYLTPAEADKFFKLHLNTRPVQVPWHETYQNYLRAQPPSKTMDNHYRPLLATADRDDGELLYVIARGIDRRHNTEAVELHKEALRAKKPGSSAWLALASEAQDHLDFDMALIWTEKAAQAGVDMSVANTDRFTLLLALGRKDEALEEIKRICKENPANIYTMVRYMHTLGHCGAGEEEKDAAIKAYEPVPGVELPYRYRMNAAAYLEAAYCYGKGDTNGYIHNLRRVADDPGVAFATALTQGDHKRARALLGRPAADDYYSWLLLYIVACEHGDTASADEYFTQALEGMKRGMKGPRGTAEMIERTGDVDPGTCIQSQYTPHMKRVLFCALGWRFPARREEYFHWARRMNYEVEFPRLLLEQNMKCQNSFLWTVR